jgi:small subunit ribosomal protein S3
MTHTVHPYSHRLAIIRDWKSRWFSTGKTYRENLIADVRLRTFVEKKLKGSYVSSVDIERRQKSIRVIIQTSRPGMVIGRNGEGAQKLRESVATFIRKEGIALEKGAEIKIDIEEVRSPESNAMIVAQTVAEMIEKRMAFRRVMKMTVEKVMANRDVQGVRVRLSGRLNGAEMSRTEQLRRGKVPLQTFRADVDYAHYEAHMTYGQIGIKVWIYRGMVFDDKARAAK